MNGYDFTADMAFDKRHPDRHSTFALLCGSDDVRGLMDVFHWNEDTVEECSNLDEIVRYTSYDGYDFISLVYVEAENGAVSQREMNLFFSRRYLVAVFPDDPGSRLTELRNKLDRALLYAARQEAPLTYLYYFIFDVLATDFSNSLEELEDEMEELAEAIAMGSEQEQSKEIGRLRKMAYTYKKLLRALSYIGGQILIDENTLLDKNRIRYFRNIDTRLIKLHDFADNLFGLSNELLHSYDSKLSSQTNDMVNRLTVITLFFGPLSVIAGIYGMNFTNMPELGWKYGYPAVLGLMAAVSLVIYIVLKKKKWL